MQAARHLYLVDMDSGMAVARDKYPLSAHDAYADIYAVQLHRRGEIVPLTGVGVSAEVIRADGQTVPLVGTVEDGVACVTLDAACYAIPGQITITVRISAGQMVRSVLRLITVVSESETDVVVDNGTIGSLAELMAAISEMRAVVETARFVSVAAAPPIVLEMTGSAGLNTASGAADNRMFLQFGVMGKTTQSGTPTADAPQELVSIPAGPVTVSVNSEDGGIMTATCTLLDDLRGIPSNIGANFTDVDGRSWVCDEIDFARGVVIKRVDRVSGESFTWQPNDKRWQKRVSNPRLDAQASKDYYPIMCNVAKYSSTAAANTCRPGNQDNAAVMVVYAPEDYDMSTVEVLYQCEPVEIPLTDEEIEQARQLVTRKGNMIITNNVGAGMHLRYVAETKRYIDNVAAGGSGSGGGGVSPVVTLTKVDNGTQITVTDIEGTKSATIYDGADGAKGDPGPAGADGSPGKDGTSVTVKSVSTSSADGGSNVVTFSDGKTVTIKNGSKGSKGDTGGTGPAGADGKTPVKGTDYFTAADKADMVSQVKSSLGYKTETWTFTLSDGSTVTKKVVLA